MMKSLILETATRLVALLMMVVAIFMLLRGHNAPGGGFIGGLIAATAFALYSIAYGVDMTQRALRVQPATLVAIGLLLALVSGVMALAIDDEPFTGLWLFVEFGSGIGVDEEAPTHGVGHDASGHSEGGLPLSTVLMFDTGVFLVVLGTVLSVLFTLEREEG